MARGKSICIYFAIIIVVFTSIGVYLLTLCINMAKPQPPVVRCPDCVNCTTCNYFKQYYCCPQNSTCNREEICFLGIQKENKNYRSGNNLFTLISLFFVSILWILSTVLLTRLCILIYYDQENTQIVSLPIIQNPCNRNIQSVTRQPSFSNSEVSVSEVSVNVR